ncbi:MAG: Rieske 2Fe-2S domain-containing protein [Xanthomonadaceae bacterium]|nr:Rieske 2Fe-2S domain-containing protein [Xanthomonadaceae bacterium]
MTTNSPEQFLLSSAELAEGQFREARAQLHGRPLWLVITRDQGTPKGWLNVCPHQGRSLNWAPDQFISDDTGNLVCAAHGAVFEVGTGHCVSGPCLGAALKPIKVEDRDGHLFFCPDP